MYYFKLQRVNKAKNICSFINLQLVYLNLNNGFTTVHALIL